MKTQRVAIGLTVLNLVILMFVQVLARGTSTSLKLVNQDGREQLIKPQ